MDLLTRARGKPTFSGIIKRGEMITKNDNIK
jgi:hypothetical protein